MPHLKLAFIPLIAGLLLGCSQSQPTLYYWGDYQKTLYLYNHPEKSSQSEQISAIETLIEQAQSYNMPAPPGVHAQLGLLYSNIGNTPKAIEQFELEKRDFPESITLMNMLLNNAKGIKA